MCFYLVPWSHGTLHLFFGGKWLKVCSRLVVWIVCPEGTWILGKESMEGKLTPVFSLHITVPRKIKSSNWAWTSVMCLPFVLHQGAEMTELVKDSPLTSMGVMRGKLASSEITQQKQIHFCWGSPLKTIYLILLLGNLTFLIEKNVIWHACLYLLLHVIYCHCHYQCHHHYFRGYCRDLLLWFLFFFFSFSMNCFSFLGCRACFVPVISRTSVQCLQMTVNLFPLTAQCWSHFVNTRAWKFRNITSSWFLLT